MKHTTIRAYICGTDLMYEIREPDMLGDCKITPNPEYAESEWPCASECGIAEIEIRFVRWHKEPNATA